MYLEYFVRVPREARLRNCRDARALLAKLYERAECVARFDLRLLHLESGGQARHASTAIRIGSRAQSLMISAVGSAAVGCLLSNASKAGALVARHFDISLEERCQQGECEVQTAADVCTYNVPSLVLSRRHFDREQNGRSLRKVVTEGLFNDPALLDQVNRILMEGINRQAGVCLLDVPPELLGDIVVHRLAPVQVKPGIYFVVGAVSFRTSLRLIGPWYAGHLQSRGYGRIFPARTASPAKPR